MKPLKSLKPLPFVTPVVKALSCWPLALGAALGASAAAAQVLPGPTVQQVPAQPAAQGVQTAAPALGNVLSSTPILQPTTVARQSCTPAVAQVATPSSGAGAVMGAIAGGAVGSNIGSGAGAALATGIGVIAGAMMGDRIEGPGTRQVPGQNCTTQNVLEYRVQGYTVLYEYQGRQYTSQMQFDPGRVVALQFVTLNPSNPGEAALTVPVPAPAQVVPITGIVGSPQVTQVNPVVVPGTVVQPLTVAPQSVFIPAPTVVGPAFGFVDPWWPASSFSSSVFIGNGWGGPGWGGWGPGWGGHYRSGWGPGWGGGSRASISIGVSRGWGWRGW